MGGEIDEDERRRQRSQFVERQGKFGVSSGRPPAASQRENWIVHSALGGPSQQYVAPVAHQTVAGRGARGVRLVGLNSMLASFSPLLLSLLLLWLFAPAVFVNRFLCVPPPTHCHSFTPCQLYCSSQPLAFGPLSSSLFPTQQSHPAFPLYAKCSVALYTYNYHHISRQRAICDLPKHSFPRTHLDQPLARSKTHSYTIKMKFTTSTLVLATLAAGQASAVSVSHQHAPKHNHALRHAEIMKAHK